MNKINESPTSKSQIKLQNEQQSESQSKSPSKLPSKSRLIEKLIIVTVAFTFLLGLTSVSAQCEDISNNVLRLHILANSDSDEDQALKLKVRDAILTSGSDTFSGVQNAKEAEGKIIENSDNILNIARNVIAEEGYDYDVTLEITDDYFPTRTYEDVTFPAGKYRAVRVVIGEGKGHNWWCVMFPALCLPGASSDSLDAVLTKDEVELVKTKGRPNLKLKTVEVAEELAGAMQGLFRNK